MRRRESLPSHVALMEKRLRQIARSPGSLSQPSIEYAWADPSSTKSVTSTSYSTFWEVAFPVGIPVSMLRTYIRVVTPSATTCELRLVWETATTSTSALQIAASSDQYAQFKWRHSVVNADILQLQAKKTGTGTPTIYEPHGLLIAASIEGATATGV